MQQLDRISAAADPSACQPASRRIPGGMLLAQVARNITPLKDALQAAIDYVQTFAVSAHEQATVACGVGGCSASAAILSSWPMTAAGRTHGRRSKPRHRGSCEPGLRRLTSGFEDRLSLAKSFLFATRIAAAMTGAVRVRNRKVRQSCAGSFDPPPECRSRCTRSRVGKGLCSVTGVGRSRADVSTSTGTQRSSISEPALRAVSMSRCRTQPTIVPSASWMGIASVPLSSCLSASPMDDCGRGVWWRR